METPMIKKHLPLKNGGFFEIRDDWHERNPDSDEYCFGLNYIGADGTRVEPEMKMKRTYLAPEKAALAVAKHVTGFDEWDDSTEQVTENICEWRNGPAPSKRPPSER